MCQKPKFVCQFDLLRFCKSIEFLSAANARTRWVVDQLPQRPGLPLQLTGLRLGKDPPSILHEKTKYFLKIP